LVNNTVFVVYPPRPPTRKITPERFGFAYSVERVACDFLDYQIYATQHVFVLLP